jgi:hypothetical protein
MAWRGAGTTGTLPVSSPRLAGIYPLARVSCGTTESYLVFWFDVSRPLLLCRMIVWCFFLSFGFLDLSMNRSVGFTATCSSS